jgi:hypothetical protein
VPHPVGTYFPINAWRTTRRLHLFWGNSDGNTAYLTWETASEQDNRGFHIEKSTDGKRFADIGFVAGQGAAQARSRYAFQDARFVRSAYYRLRQQDADGASAYSDVLLVRAGRAAAWSVFPNPVQDVLWLISDQDQPVDTAFDLTNAQGQVVLRGTIQEKGINIAHLPKGTYTLRLHMGGALEAVSIIKL